MHASVQHRLQQMITQRNVAAVVRRGTGGMSRHCLSSMCTRTMSHSSRVSAPSPLECQ
ncbi:hypothetical protein OIU74_027317 [Salix koriyanagi]|uniref:Uncharacterized protein n=1 Tax=Salix koriyanagi TaxID=2511006 RepID=A0A9Q0W0D7_9ROSI|nr:hypothetical protein OIU74_027317 [Salix koriyanagi]